MPSAGSIFVDLLLKDQNYVQGLNRARQNTRGFASQAQGDLNKTRAAFAGVLSPVNNVSSALGQLGGVLAGALSVQQLVRYTDTWKQLEGRLGLVAGEMQSISGIQSELSAIAERTRQPLEGVYNLYTRIAQAVPEAERAQYDLLGVTESINAALAITGEGSAQAASAILQFSQALTSDFKASGAEINALLDSAPRLAQAIQRSFGDGSKSLKQLVQDGDLSRDQILRALSGIGEEGIKLREELSKLPPTVGQAFTQLDNAFLQFIGNSEAANAGASTLGLSIKFLADNLDLAAKAGITISVIMVGRVVASFVAAQYVALSYQLTLARMAGVSATAATATIGLSTALRGMSLALSLAGGPIGVAFIAVVTALTFHTNEAVEAEQRYSKIIAETANSFAGYSTASAEAKEQILSHADSRISAMKRELEQLEKLVLGYASLNEANVLDSLGTGVLEGLGKLGIGTAPSEALAQYESAQEYLRQLQAERDRALNPPPNVTPSHISDPKAAANAAKELSSIYQQNRQYILGLDAATLKYNDTQEEFDRLLKAGKISQEEYGFAVKNLTEEFEKNREKVNEWGIDIESFSKKAAENIQDAFADFLFDPFDKGLDGMLKGFVDVVRRMIAEAQAAQLAKGLFGSLVEGGKGNGLLGGILGGLGGLFGGETAQSAALRGATTSKPKFFADGGFLAPGEFGVAGEEGAELLYGGKTGVSVFNQDQLGRGGNTYQIDARGADMGAVRRLEAALLGLAGPGVIEQRVMTAQTRGAL